MTRVALASSEVEESRDGVRDNVTNDHTSSDLRNEVLLSRYFPGVPLKREVDAFETLLSNRLIREELGFRKAHPWRKNVAGA